MDLIGTIGGWMVGLFAGGWFLAKFKGVFQTIKNISIKRLEAGLHGIQQDNLRSIAVHIIRYTAKQLPDATGSSKLQFAISAAQRAIPDSILSDENVEIVIESVYQEFKEALIRIDAIRGDDENSDPV